MNTLPEPNQPLDTTQTIPPSLLRVIWWLLLGILSMLLVGLMLWFYQLTSSPTQTAQLNTASVVVGSETNLPRNLNTSDELSVIAADLATIDLDLVEADLEAIARELEQAF